MYRICIFSFLLFLGFLTHCNTFAQSTDGVPSAENDTIPSEPIIFTSASASEYITNLLKFDGLWRLEGETMKYLLERLMDHYKEPMDSVRTRLNNFEYDSVEINLSYISHSDTLPLRWLNDSVFIIDTLALKKEPFITQKTFVVNEIDTSAFSLQFELPKLEHLIDSLLYSRDTIVESFIDTLFLQSKNIQLHQLIEDSIIPPLLPFGSNKSVSFHADSSRIIVSEVTQAFLANMESPFFKVPNKKMPDSLQVAVETLFSYTESRDSILLFFNDIQGQKLPLWLSTQEGNQFRFWVKNQANDSITLWIGNPSKYDITLLLEDNVNVERREKRRVDDIPITTLRPQRTLARLKPLEELPVYWDYGLSSAFTLNQNYFSNWSKGGESSLANVLDIRARAKYTNTEAKSHWTSNGRLRYGSIITKEHGFRTNTDMLELNSQYNKVIREKIDFSSVFYMKTQVAKGFNYPNDSVPVSKFLNPGTFTVGVGVEYKPFKNTSLNFSPLSYRNTFVLDTANIAQQAHGIAEDKRSRQEMGGQLVIKNSTTVLDGLNISNSVRLFSGYLDKPKNVDVDWELSLDKQISWYFMIRLNFHIIYDDDIRFPIEDAAGEPVLLPDGSPKRGPRTQFKQFMGLTLSFSI